MEVKNYWEDEEYKEALQGYSDYSKMCGSLNQFNPNDQWAFNKRDMYSKKMNEVKKNYNSNN